MANDRQDEILRDVHARTKPILGTRYEEFRNSDCPKLCENYLQVLMDECGWCYAATIALRDQLYNSSLSGASSCERWFIKKLLTLVRGSLKSGIVYLDQGSSAQTDEYLLDDLKQDPVLGKYRAIREARCVNSKSEPGIQLADAVAGRIYKRTNSPDKDVMTAYKKLRKRETAVWYYPDDASDSRDEGVQPITQRKHEQFSSQLTLWRKHS